MCRTNDAAREAVSQMKMPVKPAWSLLHQSTGRRMIDGRYRTPGFHGLVMALLIMALPACESGENPDEAAPHPRMMPGEGQRLSDAHAADSMRLGETYDEIASLYEKMMARYEDMMGEASPEMREHYEAMRRHYDDMMPGDMMDHAMMGRHMMAMHNEPNFAREMLDMHQQMAELHAREDHPEMAAMHERMTQLYRLAAQDTSAAATP